jgi:hypothetical protein
MIGYRFLSPADEEMTEASLFYEAAASGLGNDFLNEKIKRFAAVPQIIKKHFDGRA